MLPVIVGGLIAVLGGISAQVATHLLKTKHERRNLAQAFAGEIGAIVDIVQRRGYLQHIKSLIEIAKKGDIPRIYSVKITKRYFLVYEANAKNLGILSGDMPRLIAKFYTFIQALIEDVTEPQNYPNSKEAALKSLNELHDMLSEVLSEAQVLINNLKKVR